MKRRSFIQGLAAVFGTAAIAEPTQYPDPSPEAKKRVQESVNDWVYEISPIDSPLLNIKKERALHPDYIATGKQPKYIEWVEDELKPYDEYVGVSELMRGKESKAITLMEKRLANLQADVDSQLKGST